MGQSGDARDIVSVLKKNVLLVAELVAAMQLDDGSLSFATHLSSNPGSSTASVNGSSVQVSAASSMSVEAAPPPLQHPSPTHQSSLSSLTSNGSVDSSYSDGSEVSRKRCASSVAGDRVIKSMKLESPEDSPPALQVAPPAVASSSMLPPTNFSYAYPMSSATPSLPTVAELASVPAPLPSVLSNSRPPSSAGIAAHLSLGMLPDPSQHVAPPMRPALHQPSVLEPVASMSHPADFGSPASVSSAGSTVIASYPSWSDGRTAVPRQQHHHSLSTGSILTTASMVSNSMPIPGPSSMPYTTSMYSPTRSTHLQQPPLNVASATLGRASRSQSISQMHGNPFAYVPDGVSHPTMYESTQSRPSTAGAGAAAGRYSRPSSPEYDNDEDSDDEEQGNHYSPGGDPAGGEGRSSAEGTMNGSSRGHAGQRRMSRTSPANEGGGPSGHGNEVPQEYRSEVERIFFEFLNTICSNRTYPPSAPVRVGGTRAAAHPLFLA